MKQAGFHSLVRHDEVKQGPQLLERVLQRCARDEKAVVGVEGSQALVQQRVVVLQPVSLVHAQHCPVHAVQERLKTAAGTCDTLRHLKDNKKGYELCGHE